MASKNYFEKICSWLYAQLESLPMTKFPFDVIKLSLNGIYFFYEQGENADHGSNDRKIGVNNNPRPKIVCILFLFREEKTKRFQSDYERMVFYEEHQDQFNKLITVAKAKANQSIE